MSHTISASNTQQRSSIANDSCWNWDTVAIQDYIHDKLSFVKGQECKLSDSLKAIVSEVVSDMLLPCMVSQAPVIITNKKDLKTINVPYFDDYVSITDVFTAFGWFVSVADLSQDHSMVNDSYWNLKCLCNFARLCQTIAYHTLQIESQDELYIDETGVPAMVHLLYTVNFDFPIISFQGASFLISLSNSLPHLTLKPWVKPVARLKREISSATFGHAVGKLPSNMWKYGSCAETLTVLSQRDPAKHQYVYGAAMRVVSDFTTADRPPIWSKPDVFAEFRATIAHDPCVNCEIIYRRANMTFMDFAKGIVYGPSPPDHKIGEDWISKWLCYTTDCSNKPKTMFNCDNRDKGCRAAWCSLEHKKSDLEEHISNVCCGKEAQAASSSTDGSAVAASESVYLPFEPKDTIYPAFVRKTPREPTSAPAAQRVVPGSAPRAQTSQGRGKSPR